jgi:hypothetical protein
MLKIAITDSLRSTLDGAMYDGGPIDISTVSVELTDKTIVVKFNNTNPAAKSTVNPLVAAQAAATQGSTPPSKQVQTTAGSAPAGKALAKPNETINPLYAHGAQGKKA